jgi:hypothetical protein
MIRRYPGELRSVVHIALALGLAIGMPSGVRAQAYNYPALQTPRLVDREYNFAAASASRAGTSLIFQWREGLVPQWQFTLDAGLAAPQNANTRVILGGALAWQTTRSTADFPFDVALTGGAGFSSGNKYSIWRFPFGAVVGHTFDLDDGFRLTPYAHPRLSIDSCGACNGTSAGKVNIDVDVGVDFMVTSQVSLRVGALLGGTDYAGGSSSVGFSVAWTPLGLKK